MKRGAILVLAGLALALVPLSTAAGGGCHPKSNDPSGVDATGSDSAAVPIEGCRFSPTVLYVDRGTVVKWANRDTAPHTVTGFSFGSFDELMRGDAAAYRFDEEGVYPYSCILHPGMTGAIVVGDGVGKVTAGSVSSVVADPPGNQAKTPQSSGGIDTNDALLISSALAAIVGAVGFGAGVARRRRAGAIG
jgi:plastocyanin